jgi:diphthine synthase
MLYLVGIGISKDDISLGAIEACKECDIYMDKFTSRINPETLNYIEELTGKVPLQLPREELEDNVKTLAGLGSIKDIAILVGGDPLIATTHKIIYAEAKKQGVETKIIHSNSIVTTAIGESGLDFYRFGAPCTIPKWTEHYTPVSFYEKLELNFKQNEHTMLLLDYESEKEETISVKDAFKILEKAEAHYQGGIIKGGTKIILIHNILLDGGKVVAADIDKIKTMILEGVNVLIIPSSLSDVEKEAVWARTGTKW